MNCICMYQIVICYTEGKVKFVCVSACSSVCVCVCVVSEWGDIYEDIFWGGLLWYIFSWGPEFLPAPQSVCLPVHVLALTAECEN